VIDCFVDLGGIDAHCCLEVIACFVDLGGIATKQTITSKQQRNKFHQDQQNKQPPLNSNGNQFHHIGGIDYRCCLEVIVCLLILVELMTIAV
jgi:hypothetical protein